MAFLVGGANSAAADTGYDIDNSLRFNDDDSPDLGITLGTPSTANVFTFSFWFKLGDWEESKVPFSAGTDSNNFDQIVLQNDGTIIYHQKSGGSNTSYIQPSALYRDSSAWYHLVVGVDTTQSTDTNRIKMYVNGSQISSFDTETYCDQNEAAEFNTAVSHTVGTQAKGDTHADYMDGYLADFYFIDGTQYAASDFGETDEDSGIWKPKEAKDDLTFGDNGFFLEFKQTGTGTNSSGMGADTSGEDNHLAVTNLAAGDVGTDSPTNNFATWNYIAKNPNLTLSDGSLRANNTGTDSFRSALGTIGVSSGKWYWEFRGGATGDSQTFIVGWTKADVDYDARIFADSNPTVASDGYGYRSDGNKVNNDSASAYGSSWSSGTVVGIRLDLDSGTIGFIHSSDQGDAYTGLTTGIFYLPFCAVAQASNGEDAFSYTNFGGHQITANYGDFGTNTDANGYGGFTYSVPSGYYSLCTKNLAEFG